MLKQSVNWRADNSRLKFRILIFLFLLFVVSSIYLSSRGVNIKEVIDYLKNSNFRGVWFILLYIVTSFIPLPFAPTSFVGALLFPFAKAFFYTMIGSLLFSIIMFFLARLLGRDYVRYWINKHEKFKHMAKQMNEGRFRDLIMVRFFFILPAEFVNVIYGLSEINFGKYFLGTLIGTIPVIFFSIMLVRARLAHDGIFVTIAIVGLSLLVLIPLIFLANMRRCFRKKGKKC
jgi:uncharacterized membrane protein YdjX (TVP38/TMEM64 family)